MKAVLQVEHLSVRYQTGRGSINAVNDVSFSLQQGSILCLVGESGSGKTTVALALMGLLPSTAQVTSGTAIFQDDADLLRISFKRLRQIRGKDISMVFQDPPSALNPIETVGSQVAEVIQTHTNASKAVAYRQAEEALYQMGLPDPRVIMGRYPFEISGGQCQRIMMAMALVLRPKVLLADEPTSNIDVTLQAEMMELLSHQCKELGCSILWITHDMGVVAHMADEVAVMYGGHIVEQSPVREIFHRPYHPYTWGMFQSLPRLDQPDRRVTPMRGNPPDMLNMPNQCPFVPRCPKVLTSCRDDAMPSMSTVGPSHQVACYNPVDHSNVEDASAMSRP